MPLERGPVRDSTGFGGLAYSAGVQVRVSCVHLGARAQAARSSSCETWKTWDLGILHQGEAASITCGTK